MLVMLRHSDTSVQSAPISFCLAVFVCALASVRLNLFEPTGGCERTSCLPLLQKMTNPKKCQSTGKTVRMYEEVAAHLPMRLCPVSHGGRGISPSLATSR